MNIATIRGALADALRTIDLTVHERHVDNPDPPCALIFPAQPFIEPHVVMQRSMAPVHFTIRLLSRRVDVENAQDLLDAWLSISPANDQSVVEALYLDQTLGNRVQSLKVEPIDGYSQFAYGDTIYLGAEVNVMVLASRDSE